MMIMTAIVVDVETNAVIPKVDLHHLAEQIPMETEIHQVVEVHPAAVTAAAVKGKGNAVTPKDVIRHLAVVEVRPTVEVPLVAEAAEMVRVNAVTQKVALPHPAGEEVQVLHRMEGLLMEDPPAEDLLPQAHQPENRRADNFQVLQNKHGPLNGLCFHFNV